MKQHPSLYSQDKLILMNNTEGPLCELKILLPFLILEQVNRRMKEIPQAALQGHPHSSHQIQRPKFFYIYYHNNNNVYPNHHLMSSSFSNNGGDHHAIRNLQQNYLEHNYSTRHQAEPEFQVETVNQQEIARYLREIEYQQKVEDSTPCCIESEEMDEFAVDQIEEVQTFGVDYDEELDNMIILKKKLQNVKIINKVLIDEGLTQQQEFRAHNREKSSDLSLISLKSKIFHSALQHLIQRESHDSEPPSDLRCNEIQEDSKEFSDTKDHQAENHDQRNRDSFRTPRVKQQIITRETASGKQDRNSTVNYDNSILTHNQVMFTNQTMLQGGGSTFQQPRVKKQIPSKEINLVQPPPPLPIIQTCDQSPPISIRNKFYRVGGKQNTYLPCEDEARPSGQGQGLQEDFAFENFLSMLQREEENAIQNVIQQLTNPPPNSHPQTIKTSQWLRTCSCEERENYIGEKTLEIRKRYKQKLIEMLVRQQAKHVQE